MPNYLYTCTRKERQFEIIVFVHMRYYFIFMYHMLITIVAALLLLQALGAASVVVPTTTCYVLDNSSYIYDFSRWIGRPFEYDGANTDTVVRFCKDVQSRSQKGYVNFGRYDKLNYFVAGSGNVTFVQEYFNGDLLNCEMTFDKMGRTAQVNIICGNCTNRQCKGGVGCVCNVSYESNCRVVVELAIPCEEPRERVFEGFTVGFLPRTWEIVCNGMTQLGFEKAYKEFSFSTEQTHVDLYMTAIASLSSLVQKASVKIYPEQGLKVTRLESAANGVSPTTLSPTILAIDWRCETTRDTPYEVEVTIPITNYDPIQFTLSKMCESSQSEIGGGTGRWATFGLISCVFIVASTLCCCGGFIYKTRVQNQYGIDALPGIMILSSCLQTLSRGYHSPLENRHLAAQGTWTTTETTYGSI